MHILIHPLTECHFTAKDAFLLSGAKLDFSLENKTNKMREEKKDFTSNIFIILTPCIYWEAVWNPMCCMHAY